MSYNHCGLLVFWIEAFSVVLLLVRILNILMPTKKQNHDQLGLRILQDRNGEQTNKKINALTTSSFSTFSFVYGSSDNFLELLSALFLLGRWDSDCAADSGEVR